MPAAEADAPRPAEERSYIAFALTALVLALGAGIVLGIVAATRRGDDVRLVQAHGWTQLQGWLGLFVAGMGLRLMPRLAGRRPLPTRVTVAVLVLLAAGVVVRLIAQAWIDSTALLTVASAVSAAGALLLAGALAAALSSRGRAWQGWRLAAWAGTAWWVGWAALTLVGGLRANGGTVPEPVDDATVWVALLGAFSNFVWAVQARSVPVFYGRRPPGLRTLAPPIVLLNAGVALVFASAFGVSTFGSGLGLAGLATVWLAPLAGSVYGVAHRLRPGSRRAARFIVAANLWAVAAGVLMVLALSGGDALDDAALHAMGLGFMTTLILGMSQLLMPAFAGERIERARPGLESWLALPALALATALRVTGAFAPGQAGLVLTASAGAMAWIGLAAFAVGMVRAATARPGTPRPSARGG